MYKTFIALFILSFASSATIMGQSISKYKWNKRLIVVYTADAALFKKQESLFEKCKEGKNDRKLEILQKPAKKDFPFQVQLIGLDGGVKLASAKEVTCEEIFTMIDGMPMRQKEIKTQ